MTELLLVTLKPQLRKIAIKREHQIHHQFENPTSILENNLVDNLEQAEITMKLERTENSKLKLVNNIQTTLHISIISKTDNNLARYNLEKNQPVLNIHDKYPKFKGILSFKKLYNYF